MSGMYQEFHIREAYIVLNAKEEGKKNFGVKFVKSKFHYGKKIYSIFYLLYFICKGVYCGPTLSPSKNPHLHVVKT